MARISDADEARMWAEKQKRQAAASKERAKDIEVTGEVAEKLDQTTDLNGVANTETAATSGRAARFARRRTPSSKGRKWLEEAKAREAQRQASDGR